MSLFKRDKNLYAPVNGVTIDITKVKDQAFSSKMLGDGVAFEMNDDVVCSPCNGKIIFIAPTKHAFGLQTKDGVEVLIHIGLDTVNYQGEGFKQLAEYYDVKVGDPIIKVDRQFFEEKNVDTTVMMVMTNYKDYNYSIVDGNKQVNIKKDAVVEIK